MQRNPKHTGGKELKTHVNVAPLNGWRNEWRYMIVEVCSLNDNDRALDSTYCEWARDSTSLNNFLNSSSIPIHTRLPQVRKWSVKKLFKIREKSRNLVDLTILYLFLVFIWSGKFDLYRRKVRKKLAKSETGDNHFTFGSVYRNPDCLEWNYNFTN